MSSTSKESIPWKSLVSGGLAGIISRTAVSPLERLKILYQVQYVTGHAQAKYTSPLQALGRILKEEGIKGFFRGNGANAVRVFPYAGIQFLCMDLYSKSWKKALGKDTLAIWEKQLVGGFAGVTSVLFTYPLDLIRGRLTAQGGAVETVAYNGMVDGLTQTLRQEGVRGLYAGISPTLIGIFPYVGINYAAYSTVKEWSGDSFASRVLGGTVAGTMGQAVAYPLDLLRRRFQLQTMPSNPGKTRYTSVGDAVGQILRSEGVLGLYKGFGVNFIKTAPTIAIMFVAQDGIKDLLSS